MENDASRKDRLIKRLRYLWTWEPFDSFLLPAMAIFLSRHLERPLGFFAISGAGLVAWILIGQLAEIPHLLLSYGQVACPSDTARSDAPRGGVCAANERCWS